tara:strand:- start:858 stop:1532 length:675 start_codon:yes stop_codon:yes gene_type:complete
MNNEDKFAQMWAAQESLIQKNLHMNTTALKEIKTFKAQNSMRGFLYLNIFSLVVGAIMCSASAYFIFTHLQAFHMILSGGIALMWSLLICVGAIKHLNMQLTLNYSKPVTDVQHQLNEIRLSALYFLRASLMVIPFYFAFLLMFFEIVFAVDLYVSGNPNWLISQGVFSLIMAAVAVYLYRKLSAENIDKHLAKLLMAGFGSQAYEAIGELKVLEKFELELEQK